MKKSILLFCFSLTFSFSSIGQEWFTSFDVAKRMALAQNKMLFVIWDDALQTPYYIEVNDENGKKVLVDLTRHEEVNAIIWDYFIPLLMPESEYGKLLDKAKNIRGTDYLSKLEDDSIKIMDVNGAILNSEFSLQTFENLPDLIKLYALNTSYLNPYLRNYLKKVNFTTTFILASKYFDFAILNTNQTRFDIVTLADGYLEEARILLEESDLDNKRAFLQKLEFFKIKELLILNQPKKAKRLLKRIKVSEIAEINKELFVFLNYTTFMLLKDEVSAAPWKAKLSFINLKKAELIIANKPGRS
jgi:hypothetical protein